MATLTVGPTGAEYTSISAAVAASHNGDTIEVAAGTYVNDFPTITDNITIEGIGGIAYLDATVSPGNGKAIMLVGTEAVQNVDVTIKDLGFENAAVPSENGAGIKLQYGQLVVEDSYFHNNQMGILTGDGTATTLTVLNSEFAGEHTVPGSLAHQIYAGSIGSLDVENSLFLADANGHQIKSRAETTTVTHNTIDDGQGTTSYDVDVPNGGNATISDNTIVKGVNDPNTTVIAYGEEGVTWGSNSLTVSNNIIDNQLTGNHGIGVYNASTTVAQIDNNEFYHLPTVAVGPNAQSGNVTLATAPTVIDTDPIVTSPANPIVTSPGTLSAAQITAATEATLTTALSSWTTEHGHQNLSTFAHGIDDVLYLIETPGATPAADTHDAAVAALIPALGSYLASWNAAEGAGHVTQFNHLVETDVISLEGVLPQPAIVVAHA